MASLVGAKHHQRDFLGTHWWREARNLTKVQAKLFVRFPALYPCPPAIIADTKIAPLIDGRRLYALDKRFLVLTQLLNCDEDNMP